jgi:hypothetical protein
MEADVAAGQEVCELGRLVGGDWSVRLRWSRLGFMPTVMAAPLDANKRDGGYAGAPRQLMRLGVQSGHQDNGGRIHHAEPEPSLPAINDGVGSERGIRVRVGHDFEVPTPEHVHRNLGIQNHTRTGWALRAGNYAGRDESSGTPLVSSHRRPCLMLIALRVSPFDNANR